MLIVSMVLADKANEGHAGTTTAAKGLIRL